MAYCHSSPAVTPIDSGIANNDNAGNLGPDATKPLLNFWPTYSHEAKGQIKELKALVKRASPTQSIIIMHHAIKAEVMLTEVAQTSPNSSDDVFLLKITQSTAMFSQCSLRYRRFHQAVRNYYDALRTVRGPSEPMTPEDIAEIVTAVYAFGSAPDYSND